MSEVCNLCKLQAISRDAEKNKYRIFQKLEGGGIAVHKLKLCKDKPTQENKIAWFCAIPRNCSCE